jgi:multiple sugar transport system permease protein
MPDRIMRYLLLVPALVIVLGTTLWPLGSAIATSFRNWRLKRSPVPQGWVGLDNYAFAFEEPEFWNALQVTAVFVTHSVFESVYLSQRIVVMAARPGRVKIGPRTRGRPWPKPRPGS